MCKYILCPNEQIAHVCNCYSYYRDSDTGISHAVSTEASYSEPVVGRLATCTASRNNSVSTQWTGLGITIEFVVKLRMRVAAVGEPVEWLCAAFGIRVRRTAVMDRGHVPGVPSAAEPSKKPDAAAAS